MSPGIPEPAGREPAVTAVRKYDCRPSTTHIGKLFHSRTEHSVNVLLSGWRLEDVADKHAHGSRSRSPPVQYGLCRIFKDTHRYAILIPEPPDEAQRRLQQTIPGSADIHAVWGPTVVFEPCEIVIEHQQDILRGIWRNHIEDGT